MHSDLIDNIGLINAEVQHKTTRIQLCATDSQHLLNCPGPDDIFASHTIIPLSLSLTVDVCQLPAGKFKLMIKQLLPQKFKLLPEVKPTTP